MFISCSFLHLATLWATMSLLLFTLFLHLNFFIHILKHTHLALEDFVQNSYCKMLDHDNLTFKCTLYLYCQYVTNYDQFIKLINFYFGAMEKLD